MTKRLVGIFVLMLVAGCTATAQTEDVPRYEVGVQFSTLTIRESDRLTSDYAPLRTEPGVGGRFTYNFTNSVAAEAEMTFFPNDSGKFDFYNFNFYTDGRALQGLFGLKVGKRFERFGIFAKARPGFVRFSRAFSGSRPVDTPSGRDFELQFNGRTNLAIDIGGVLEFYPSRRIVARFDIGDTIIHYRALTYDVIPACPVRPEPCPTQTTFTLPSRTQHSFQFSAGIGIRFPAPAESAPSRGEQVTDTLPRFEVGALFSSITIASPNRYSFVDDSFLRTEPGIGGRFTYNITRSFAAESEIIFFPNSDDIPGPRPRDYVAGRITQGLFGVKAGKRFERFGIFGKARPGFVHFSQALSGTRPMPTPTGDAFFDIRGRSDLAVDVGGVLEFYPSRRIVTRFDVGDTIIHYKELRYQAGTVRNSFVVTLPGRTQSNFQFNAGIGIRF